MKSNTNVEAVHCYMVHFLDRGFRLVGTGPPGTVCSYVGGANLRPTLRSQEQPLKCSCSARVVSSSASRSRFRCLRPPHAPLFVEVPSTSRGCRLPPCALAHWFTAARGPPECLHIGQWLPQADHGKNQSRTPSFFHDPYQTKRHRK